MMFRKTISLLLVFSVFVFSTSIQLQEAKALSPQEISAGEVAVGGGAAILGAPAWVPAAAFALAVGAMVYASCSEDQRATINRLFQKAMEHGFPLRKDKPNYLAIAKDQALIQLGSNHTSKISQFCSANPVSEEQMVTEMRLTQLFGQFGLLNEQVLSNEVLFNAAFDDAFNNWDFLAAYRHEVRLAYERQARKESVRYVSQEQEQKLREFCSGNKNKFIIFSKLLSKGLAITAALAFVADITFQFLYGGIINSFMGWWFGLNAAGSAGINGIQLFRDILKMCQEERIQSDLGRNATFIRVYSGGVILFLTALVVDRAKAYIKAFRAHKSK